MKTSTTARIVVLVLMAAVLPAFAAGPAPAATDEQTDAIVRKLEQSGALDAAGERAINRYVQRKEAEQARHDAGAGAGVSGTPATVVRNNKTDASQVVVGALPAEALIAVIDRMLAGKP